MEAVSVSIRALSGRNRGIRFRGQTSLGSARDAGLGRGTVNLPKPPQTTIQNICKCIQFR